MRGLARKIVLTLALMPLLGAASVFAGTVLPAAPTSTISENGWGGVIDLINLLRNWIYGIVGTVVVIFILIAAFNFMASGGDETKLKKAKGMLKNALVALVIAILSASIVFLITSFIDAGSSSSNSQSPTTGQTGGVQTPNGTINPVTPAPLVSGCNLSGCILPGQICDTANGNCVYGSGKSCTQDEQCATGEWCKDSICQSSSGNPVGSQGTPNTGQGGQQTPTTPPAGLIQSGDVCYGNSNECVSGICDCSTLISSGKCFCK